MPGLVGRTLWSTRRMACSPASVETCCACRACAQPRCRSAPRAARAPATAALAAALCNSAVMALRPDLAMYFPLAAASVIAYRRTARWDSAACIRLTAITRCVGNDTMTNGHAAIPYLDSRSSNAEYAFWGLRCYASRMQLTCYASRMLIACVVTSSSFLCGAGR